MDLTKYRQKLIGNEDERAVSPVIGVILMVAITVILAAVIAAFVLDMGSGLNDSAQAGVSVSEGGTDEVTVSVESLSKADRVEIRDSSGEIVGTGTGDGDGDDGVMDSVGSSLTLTADGTGDVHSLTDGDYAVVAVFEDGTGSNTVANFEVDTS